MSGFPLFFLNSEMEFLTNVRCENSGSLLKLGSGQLKLLNRRDCSDQLEVQQVSYFPKKN